MGPVSSLGAVHGMQLELASQPAGLRNAAIRWRETHGAGCDIVHDMQLYGARTWVG